MPASGRFQPGKSGNPAGRPAGSRNQVTQLCADLLADNSAALIGMVIGRAMGGCTVSLRLCIERLIPIRASRDRVMDGSVELTGVRKAADLAQAAGDVIAAASAGDISLSEAEEFMRLLEGQRRIIETTDLVLRLEALESGGPLPAGGARREIGFRGPMDAPPLLLPAPVAPDLAGRLRK